MAEEERGDGDVSPQSLTERELVVLELVVAGRSNEEIGAILGIAATTVSVHRARIFEKLDVSSRAGAARWARSRRLFDDPRPED